MAAFSLIIPQADEGEHLARTLDPKIPCSDGEPSTCAVAPESLCLYNEIHGVQLTVAKLKRSAACFGRLETAANSIPA